MLTKHNIIKLKLKHGVMSLFISQFGLIVELRLMINLFFEHWYTRNINYIADINNEEGDFYSLYEIQSKYKI